MAKKQVTLEMAELFRSGMTMQQIGDRYGVSRQRVQQRLASVGITGDVRPPKYELIARERLVFLYSTERLSIKKIGEALGTSSDVIRQAIEFYKLPPRKPLLSDGKHVDLLRELKLGETAEIVYPASRPHVVLQSAARRSGIKISVRKQEAGKFQITRIS